ncbi:MAG: hypothetical protein E7632_06405 [Ruminococcaceae bacterium]|nr:hypothetical protein [Oscillospiraceae bacterium]
MAKFERQLNTRFSEVVRRLDAGLAAKFPELELVDSAVSRFGAMTVCLYCYRLATLQIVGSERSAVSVTAIASAGGEPFIQTVEALLAEFAPIK